MYFIEISVLELWRESEFRHTDRKNILKKKKKMERIQYIGPPDSALKYPRKFKGVKFIWAEGGKFHFIWIYSLYCVNNSRNKGKRLHFFVNLLSIFQMMCGKCGVWSIISLMVKRSAKWNSNSNLQRIS